MTRIVRFEEIDGKLMFEVPADVAKRLGFAAGGEALLKDGDANVTLERVDDRVRRQLEVGRRIIKENHAVLAALAK